MRLIPLQIVVSPRLDDDAQARSATPVRPEGDRASKAFKQRWLASQSAQHKLQVLLIAHRNLSMKMRQCPSEFSQQFPPFG